MRLRILELWRRIRASFWFLPTLMVGAAISLAFANLFLDRTLTGPWQQPPPWLAVAGTESARSLLSTIAGSMITVAGVTFSVVIVALTLASSQFGPRLVVGFMDDRGNQVVLGTFVSVFAYCLVVLLHLPGEEGSRWLPQISVLTGVALALLGVGVLIFFFHHISDSMQVGHLVADAGQNLSHRVRKLPERAADSDQAWPPSGFGEANASLRAERSGYLSSLDLDNLANIACRHGLRIMMVPRLGEYVLASRVLARISPADAVTEAIKNSIRGTFAVVDRREESADLSLSIERLAEIAVRGLSPGINDPYTAIAAIHRLASGLDELLDRLPVDCRYQDAEGEARVFYRSIAGADALEMAFGQIRKYGSGDVEVLGALVESLTVLENGRRRRWLPALRRQVERVAETAREGLQVDHQRDRIERLCDRARVALDQA